MTIPVETLVLWEQHYKRGDYAKLSTLTGLAPKRIVNHIHNADMPPNCLKILTDYYEAKEKQSLIGI